MTQVYNPQMKHGVVMAGTKSIIRRLLVLVLAIGLANAAQAGITPSPTATPTDDPFATPTATPTTSPIPTPTATPSASPIPTPTATPSATGTPTATPTALPPTAFVHHFLCYKASPMKRAEKFKNLDESEREVELTNQFQPSGRDVLLVKTEHFCTVVKKNNERVNDPFANLTCYSAKPSPANKLKVTSTNQFGVGSLDVQKRKTELCVPSSILEVLGTPTPTATPTVDPSPPSPTVSPTTVAA